MIEGVSRYFGSVAAVNKVALTIEDGEFFTLLGPSGCGKTTLLRMIAGFTELDAGRIHIGEKRIDTIPPHRRNIGMVFQNYAIFPNQTVAGNVAYGVSKAGVHALTFFLAREVAADGITVNAVAPGPIASDMTTNFPAALRALIPVGRMGRAEEVAAAVAFLAGPSAGFITGEVLDVNGGMWAD